ncbi:type IV pilin [Halobaculum sp. MBLA0147]|uniref:DUF7289 family protein n=1 Tax=Halobaculum sp. MBLA0147 TaxID=3079934 RepID=UPI0035244764
MSRVVDRTGVDDRRAQSHVVGVALLLGFTTLALAGVTASVGTTVDTATDAVTERRVADALTEATRASGRSGPDDATVGLTDGHLAVVDRTVRVWNDTEEIVVDSDALVYRSEGVRVAAVAGAVVRGPPGAARLHRSLGVGSTASTLVVGVTTLDASDETSGHSWSFGTGATTRPRPTTLDIATDVTHDARRHPPGEWTVAVETATPAPFERFFEARGATVRRRDLDGDGVDSVVAAFASSRRLVVVVHRLGLEVTVGV